MYIRNPPITTLVVNSRIENKSAKNAETNAL